jgi:hypothetical protein
MKLYELIDFEPKQSKHGAHDAKNKITTKTNAKFIGAGAFGAAYDTQSNKRLNQITKVGRTGGIMTGKHAQRVEQDGWLAYMHAVHNAQQHGKNNPYFPLMDDLRIRKDAKGELTYSANLHKLIPLDTAKLTSNIELMKSVYERMFGTECPYNEWDLIRESMINNLQSSNNLADPALKTVMNMIDSIIDRSGGGNSDSELIKDIHKGNVMWRMTGTMLQLVIVDPIA